MVWFSICAAEVSTVMILNLVAHLPTHPPLPKHANAMKTTSKLDLEIHL